MSKVNIAPANATIGAGMVMEAPSRQLPILLPAADVAHRVRPLRGLSKADSAALAEAVHRALREWQIDWGLETATVDGSNIRDRPSSCRIVSEAEGASDFAYLQWSPAISSKQGVWWALEPAMKPVQAKQLNDRRQSHACSVQSFDPKAILQTALFGESSSRAFNPASAPLAGELVQAAWSDWCKRLVKLFHADHDATPSSLNPSASCHQCTNESSITVDPLRPWSGAVVLNLAWCATTLMLMLSGQAVVRWLQRQGKHIGQDSDSRCANNMGGSGPLVPVLQAIGSQTLQVRVEMAPAEINLGTLAALRVGDILRTTHSIETPLLVCSAIDNRQERGSAMLCDGFLGKQGEHRAVELLRSTTLS